MPAKQTIVWQTLGTFSGQGSVMTESFLFEGGVLRVSWEARKNGSAGKGTFRLAVASAVSGRELAVVADHDGPGKGETYIPEEPRPTYLLVDSKNLDWSVTVEEGHAGMTGTTGASPAPSSHGTH